jgi:hypothetical protein
VCIDPFLMLDEFHVTKPAGFPDHPHRGFETVTYMLGGAFVHEDFAGHKVRRKWLVTVDVSSRDCVDGNVRGRSGLVICSG